MSKLFPMQRVAVVLPDLAIIGAQRVAIDFGLKLAERGYIVDFVCGGSGIWEQELKCINFRNFNARLSRRIRGFRIIERFLRLGYILYEQNYEVVLSVTPLLNRVTCFLKYFGLLQGRLVIEDHAYPPRSYMDEFPNLFVRLFYRQTETLYLHADILRTLTDDCKFYYQKRCPGVRAISFPNLMDLERIQSLAKLPVADDECFDIVYIGRFETQKNIGFLITSFFELQRSVNSTLAIIGYGELNDVLRDKVKELGLQSKVSFLNNGKQNFSILQRAKVFPLVSLWEGYPLVVIEAMAVGTAVVAVDCKTGPRELLGDDSARGWLVPEGDTAAFARALEAALTDTKTREKKSKLALSFVQDRLDINRRFDEYIHCFINGGASNKN